jgi:hypothetical protein
MDGDPFQHKDFRERNGRVLRPGIGVNDAARDIIPAGDGVIERGPPPVETSFGSRATGSACWPHGARPTLPHERYAKVLT